jgi:hypothetical protein
MDAFWGTLRRMDNAVDFVVESPHSDNLLLVEAKSISAPSAEWAGRLARNVLANAAPQTNRFLLLVLRNYLYLWKHHPQEGSELPDFSARTEEVLEPYLRHVQTSLHDLSGLSFELLVKSWLTDLTEGSIPPSVEKWIRAAGLQQFENGVLRQEQRN